jgi:hypothetical protein
MKKRLLFVSLFTLVVALTGFAQSNKKNVQRPEKPISAQMRAWIDFLGNNANSQETANARKAPRKVPASWSYPSESASEPFGGGSGTETDPYIIGTAQQLANLAYEVNNGNNYAGEYFKMTADIELNSGVLQADGSLGSGSYQTWTPIGNAYYTFNGIFDGDGHHVSGIFIDDPDSDYLGLFGRSKEGLIKNLGVEDSYIHGYDYLGGILGHSDRTSISNCYNAATVTGVFDVGGIVGDDSGLGGDDGSINSYITGCANYGLITASSSCAGGITGYGSSALTVSYCINYGTITGTGNCTGGIVGEYNCIMENCANTGTIKINGSYSEYGAICCDGNMTNCYYLDSTCDQNDGSNSMTAAQFADGTVTSLLDPSGTYFVQGEDGLPALKNLNKSFTPAGLVVPGTVIWSSDEAQTVDWNSGKSIIIPAENFADVKVGDILNIGVLGAPDGANPDNWSYQIGLQDPTVWKFIEANLPLNQSGDYVHSFVVTGDMLKYMQANGMAINGTAFNVKTVAVESAYSGSEESIWVGNVTLGGWPPVTVYEHHFQNANDFAGIEAGQVIRVNCSPATGSNLTLRYQGEDTGWSFVDLPGVDMNACATETGYDVPITEEIVSILKTDRLLLFGDGSVQVTSVELVDDAPADPSEVSAMLAEIEEAKKLLKYSMNYYDENNEESPETEGKALVDAIRDAENQAETAATQNKIEKTLEALKQAEIDYTNALMEYELAESEAILADADPDDELAAEIQRLYDTQDVVREDYSNQPKHIKNYADEIDKAQKAYLRKAIGELIPEAQALADNPEVKDAIKAANEALEGDSSEDLFDALNGLKAAMDSAIGEMTPLDGDVATFEDLTLDAESFWQGIYEEERDEDEIGICYNTFKSGSFQFDNYYSPEYGGFWGNFAYSNQTSSSYESLADQFHAVTGGGHESATFGVAFPQGGSVTFMDNAEGTVIPGFYITNSAYAYTSMLNGDAYAKKFAQGDWFKLTITGLDADGKETGTKEFYLADLRDADSSKHFIVNDWRYVDLSGLGKVKSLKFMLDSSDTGSWGINTPGYFCIDDFGANGVETQPAGNIPTGISGVAVYENAANTPVYNLNGQRVNGNAKGIVIKNGKKYIVK